MMRGHAMDPKPVIRQRWRFWISEFLFIFATIIEYGNYHNELQFIRTKYAFYHHSVHPCGGTLIISRK